MGRAARRAARAGTHAVIAWPAALCVAGWALLIVAGHLLGAALYARQPLVHIGAAPLVGSFDLRLTARVLPALALAAAAIAWGPALAVRLRWRGLLACSWAGAAGWAVALAATDGSGAIAAPLATRYEQLSAVSLVGTPGTFLASFTDVLATYPTHVQGHPPVGVLLLWALDGAGLGGATAAAALTIACGALTAPPVLVAVRALASEARARAARAVSRLHAGGRLDGDVDGRALRRGRRGRDRAVRARLHDGARPPRGAARARPRGSCSASR